MKIGVRIENREFEVEVGDLEARPIIAVVDGERFEVWPTTDSETGKPMTSAPSTPTPTQTPTLTPTANSNSVHAPIPGVIVSVAVQPGAVVTLGQELCALEAMKMKNVIRAGRAGTIGAVRVSVGQHVRHKDVLMEYTE